MTSQTRGAGGGGGGMDFLHRVLAVVILDDAGQRLFAKYYSGDDKLATVARQRALEMAWLQAQHTARRTTSSTDDVDIVLVDGYAVLFQTQNDVSFLVVGGKDENELVLATLVRTLVDSLKEELNVVELYKRQLLERYDAVVLTVDEMLDDGIVLEADATNIANDVNPFIGDTGIEIAHKTLSAVNKYLQDNF